MFVREEIIMNTTDYVLVIDDKYVQNVFLTCQLIYNRVFTKLKI